MKKLPIRHEHHFKLTFSARASRASSGVTFTTDRFNYEAPSPGQLADRVASVTPRHVTPLRLW